jgi:hypothetical protein
MEDDYNPEDFKKGDSFENLMSTLHKEGVFKEKLLNHLEELYHQTLQEPIGFTSMENEAMQQITILHIFILLLRKEKTEELLKLLAKNFPEEYLLSVFG